MAKASDIQAVNIALEVDGNYSLFILLAADGSINRQGTGTLKNSARDIFIGMTKEPYFAALMTHMNDEMLEFMGRYELAEQQGASCKLSIGLQFADGEQNGFEFNYGSESQGLPREIGEFVIAAVQITDPWYKAQQKMVKAAEEPKPWWKVW
jgi:hypothetical protein